MKPTTAQNSAAVVAPKTPPSQILVSRVSRRFTLEARKTMYDVVAGTVPKTITKAIAKGETNNAIQGASTTRPIGLRY